MRPHNRERDEAIRRRIDAGEPVALIAEDVGLKLGGVYSASKRALARARGEEASRLVPKLDPTVVAQDRLSAAKRGADRIAIDAMTRAEIAGLQLANVQRGVRPVDAGRAGARLDFEHPRQADAGV